MSTINIVSNNVHVNWYFCTEKLINFILLIHFEMNRNLRNNLIHWIPEQAFTRRLPLPPLPFSANQSTSTLASAASAETNSTLTKLDLGSNPLVQVHRYAFVNLPQLRKL